MINSVNICGRLTKDCEVSSVGDYTKLAYSIAVSKYSSKEKKEKVMYFYVNTFVKSSKQADYYKSMLIKGMKVFVNGSLEQQSYEKNGEKKSLVLINTNNIEFGSGNKDGDRESSDTSRVPQNDGEFPEDIPF